MCQRINSTEYVVMLSETTNLLLSVSPCKEMGNRMRRRKIFDLSGSRNNDLGFDGLDRPNEGVMLIFVGLSWERMQGKMPKACRSYIAKNKPCLPDFFME